MPLRSHDTVFAVIDLIPLSQGLGFDVILGLTRLNYQSMLLQIMNLVLSSDIKTNFHRAIETGELTIYLNFSSYGFRGDFLIPIMGNQLLLSSIRLFAAGTG